MAFSLRFISPAPPGVTLAAIRELAPVRVPAPSRGLGWTRHIQVRSSVRGASFALRTGPASLRQNANGDSANGVPFGRYQVRLTGEVRSEDGQTIVTARVHLVPAMSAHPAMWLGAALLSFVLKGELWVGVCLVIASLVQHVVMKAMEEGLARETTYVGDLLARRLEHTIHVLTDRGLHCESVSAG